MKLYNINREKERTLVNLYMYFFFLTLLSAKTGDSSQFPKMTNETEMCNYVILM